MDNWSHNYIAKTFRLRLGHTAATNALLAIDPSSSSFLPPSSVLSLSPLSHKPPSPSPPPRDHQRRCYINVKNIRRRTADYDACYLAFVCAAPRLRRFRQAGQILCTRYVRSDGWTRACQIKHHATFFREKKVFFRLVVVCVVLPMANRRIHVFTLALSPPPPAIYNTLDHQSVSS